MVKSLFLFINLTFLVSAFAVSEEERLLSLDLENLMNLEVTSVSKSKEKLFDAASAVHVISSEDIRRSGAQKLPDALRMVPGLQVKRTGNASWEVGSRGFDGVYSNKLLVLVDGRSIYTPVFSGVYWSSTMSSLENIDQIEVIRGPGSALWGSNAVNGVININTKHARDTQGTRVVLSYGTEKKEIFYRHGFALDDDDRGFVRIYGTFDDYDSLEDGRSWSSARPHDDWHHFESGFRMDYDISAEDSIKLSGEYFYQDSQADPSIGPLRDFVSDGFHIIGEYRKTWDSDHFLNIRAYFDHVVKETPSSWTQGVDTYEIDADYHIKLADRHELTFGAGMRVYRIKTQRGDPGVTLIGFGDNRFTEHNYNSFIQDKITLVEDRLTLTIGAKYETLYKSLQPTARLAWTPNAQNTIWAAYSHARRSPSFFETDVRFYEVIPNSGLFAFEGSDDVNPEDLEAFEVGYRVKATRDVYVDTTVFYNRYSELVAFGSAPGSALPNIPATANNDARGYVLGWETAVTWQVRDDWKLMATYTLTKVDLDLKDNGTILDATEPYIFYPEDATAEQKGSLRSLWNVADNLDFDISCYYVGATSGNLSPSELSPVRYDPFLTMDARVAWRPMGGLEVSLAGYNLLDSSQEQGSQQVEVSRSVLATLDYQF